MNGSGVDYLLISVLIPSTRAHPDLEAYFYAKPNVDIESLLMQVEGNPLTGFFVEVGKNVDKERVKEGSIIDKRFDSFCKKVASGSEIEMGNTED